MLCAFSQAPGNAIISRQVAPSTIIRQGCPAPTSLAATTTLHRPPILQVTPSVGVKSFLIMFIWLAVHCFVSITGTSCRLKDHTKCLNHCLKLGQHGIILQCTMILPVYVTKWHLKDLMRTFFHNEKDSNSHSLEDVMWCTVWIHVFQLFGFIGYPEHCFLDLQSQILCLLIKRYFINAIY